MCSRSNKYLVWFGLLRLNASATARVISRRGWWWWNVSLVEETGAPGGNHQPTASNWQTFNITININKYFIIIIFLNIIKEVFGFDTYLHTIKEGPELRADEGRPSIGCVHMEPNVLPVTWDKRQKQSMKLYWTPLVTSSILFEAVERYKIKMNTKYKYKESNMLIEYVQKYTSRVWLLYMT